MGIAFGRPILIPLSKRQLGVNQARLSASHKSRQCRDAKSRRDDQELIGAKVTPAERRISVGDPDEIGLVDNEETETDTEEAAEILRQLGLTVAKPPRREFNMTFSQAKREVDLAIRRGQLPEFQREGALHVATTNPRAWKQLLACMPIECDERKFIATVRPEFRSVGPREPGRTATHREIFTALGLVDAGWNPKPTW